jgi:hypothetical protein
MTFGESTSGKLSDFEYKSHRLWVWSLEMLQKCGRNTYEQGESRRGEETEGNGWMSPYTGDKVSGS